MEDLLGRYITTLFVTGIGVGIIEVLAMFFSMLLICAIRKIDDFKA